MYKQILGILALAFSLVLSPAVFANSGECGEGLKQMVDSMNLDSAQKDKIKPIMDNLKSTMKQSMSQMQDLRKQIDDQATSANMDQSAVNNLIDQQVKVIGDMMKAKVSAKNQIFAVLNDKQKADLKAKIKKVEDKMAEKFKNCHDQD